MIGSSLSFRNRNKLIRVVNQLSGNIIAIQIENKTNKKVLSRSVCSRTAKKRMLSLLKMAPKDVNKVKNKPNKRPKHIEIHASLLIN